MIAQQNKNEALSQAPEVQSNEETAYRSEMMTTQTMVNGNVNQASNRYQDIGFARTTDEISSKWASLMARLSQIFWRVSFEVEPVVGGLFSPFTAQIRRCRGLSGRDKAELEALMKKR